MQIFTTILESLLIEVQKLKTAKEVWFALCAKHKKKALTVVVDIHHHMYEMKCKEKSQVHMHLETLARMQEQLAGMGVGLPDTDLITVNPWLTSKVTYQPLMKAILMSATQAKVNLMPNKVIESLLDEFE